MTEEVFSDVTEAVFEALYGKDANPFIRPESWEFAEQVARAAIEAICELGRNAK